MKKIKTEIKWGSNSILGFIMQQYLTLNELNSHITDTEVFEYIRREFHFVILVDNDEVLDEQGFLEDFQEDMKALKQDDFSFHLVRTSE